LLPINESESIRLTGILKKLKNLLGDNCIKKVYLDRGLYSLENFAYILDSGMDLATKGKSNTHFYEEAKKIDPSKYEKVVIPKESYKPKTERGKKSQNERLKNIKPSDIAETEVTFKQNGQEYKLRMIVKKKLRELSKKDKLILLLKEQKNEKSASELLKSYLKKYGKSFSCSKNPTATIRRYLMNIPQVNRSIVLKKEGGKQKVYKFQLMEDVNLNLVENNTKKEVFKLWLTTNKSLDPLGVIMQYKNRWRVEIFFREQKSEWKINKFPSRKFNIIMMHVYFKFISYLVISIFKRGLTEKYRNMGIKRLKVYLINKIGFICCKKGHIEVEFYEDSYRDRVNEQLKNMDAYFASLGYT
jgi:hypothetical protein